MGILNILFGLSSECGDETGASDLATDLGVNEASGLPLIPRAAVVLTLHKIPAGLTCQRTFVQTH